MRCLVTGAAGFLGSHLCDALLGEGHEVFGIDNFSTGNRRNLAHLANEPRMDFREHDICQPFDFGHVDYIFNFASPASPPGYMRLGIETLLVGSEGTKNSLDVASKYNAGFLHASTSECYGDPTVHPQPETYWGHVNPIGPRSVYDESKRYAEALTMAYHRYRNVNTHLVRIFNTYGPRLDPGDGRVISNFVTQALSGNDITVYGEGQQTRSFCFVSDLIDGILRLSRSEEHLPVNIGNPDEWTILECARQVISLSNSSSRIRFEPLPQDDPVRRRPDITRATTLLGWKPTVNLRTGLQMCLEYFRAFTETDSNEQPESEQSISGVWAPSTL